MDIYFYSGSSISAGITNWQIGKRTIKSKWVSFALFEGTHFGEWTINEKCISVQKSAFKVVGSLWIRCHLGRSFLPIPLLAWALLKHVFLNFANKIEITLIIVFQDLSSLVPSDAMA